MSEWTGGSVVLTHDVYDRWSVAQAVDDYKAFLAVIVVSQNAEETVVDFSRTGDAAPPSEQVVREFLNYLLDLSVRARLRASG
jgi:hypothetical protein